MARLLTLRNERWEIGVLPETGASLAFGRVRVGDAFRDLLRPTEPSRYGEFSECASFVLSPWSNRIRDGRFEYRGRRYDVGRDFADGTAIHGRAKNFAWSSTQYEDRISMSVLLDPAQSGFPWAFSSRVDLSLHGSSFVMATSLRNEDREPFPAGVGHHPYFMRSLSGVNDDVTVRLPFARYYPAPDCLPRGPSVPVEPRVDFRAPRALGLEPIDDCLTGRDPSAPVVLSYPSSGVAIVLDCDPVLSHLVLYVPPRDPYFAVEPVTHCNDAFNLAARGVPDTGFAEVFPGEELRASFTLTVTAPNDVHLG